MRYENENGWCDVQEGLEFIDQVEQHREDQTAGDPGLLQTDIGHLEGFRQAAEKTASACRQKINMLETKRGQLKGQEAFAKLDQAIARLDQVLYQCTDLSEELSRAIDRTRCKQRSWEAQAALSSQTRPAGTSS
jgi:hypothetical protein